MRESEAALVVAKIISYDGRLRARDEKAHAAMVANWHEGLSDLLLADCLAAVAAFYRDSDGWIMVKHIRERVTAVRLARLRAAPYPDIPAWIADDHPREYATLFAAANAAIMDGLDPAPVIAAATARVRELAR